MVELLNEIIEGYKNNIIRDTQKLISFNSIYEESSRTGSLSGLKLPKLWSAPLR